MNRRSFLRNLFGGVLVAPTLVQPKKVYSFIWNNPLHPPLGDFEKYCFPLVRSIFPELDSDKLVHVQPMMSKDMLAKEIIALSNKIAKNVRWSGRTYSCFLPGYDEI